MIWEPLLQLFTRFISLALLQRHFWPLPTNTTTPYANAFFLSFCENIVLVFCKNKTCFLLFVIYVNKNRKTDKTTTHIASRSEKYIPEKININKNSMPYIT